MCEPTRLRAVDIVSQIPTADIPCSVADQLPPRLLNAYEAAAVTVKLKQAARMGTVIFAAGDDGRPTRAQLRQALGLPLLFRPYEDGGFPGLDEQAAVCGEIEKDVEPNEARTQYQSRLSKPQQMHAFQTASAKGVTFSDVVEFVPFPPNWSSPTGAATAQTISSRKVTFSNVIEFIPSPGSHPWSCLHPEDRQSFHDSRLIATQRVL